MNTLKQFLFLILCLLAVACSDRANEPSMDDGDNASGVIPTADQLTTTTALPVTILGSGFSEVAEAFIDRVQQPLSDITDDTRAILVRGNDLGTQLTNPSVRSAIDSGAVLIIDQPTRQQLEKTIDSVCLAEDFILSMDGEEHDYHICYDMVTLDRFGNLYVLNDIFDEDNDTTTITMTPYLKGLHADPLAGWLNEYYGSTPLRSRARVCAATGDLASLLSAQNITKTYTLKPNGDWSHKIAGKQCIFTVSTNIWVVYKFDDDADYYLIEQTVLGNSQNFWVGKWGHKKWSYQGFFLQNVYVDNKLRRNGKVLPQSQGAYLLDYSPTTTIGQTSVTTTESWNFSAQIGYNSKREASGAVSGGVGGSVGTTYSTQDMTITAKSGSDNACNNNACWSFDIKTDNFKSSWWTGISFVDPPALGRNAYKSSQCWQWKVEHPKTHGNLQFCYDVSFCFAYNCYRNNPSRKKETNYSNEVKNTEYVTIRPPYRGEAK